MKSQGSITRRKFVGYSLVAAAGLLIEPRGASAETSQEHLLGIEEIQHGSNEFLAALDHHFPDLRPMDGFDQILPFLRVFVNKTNRPIHGLAVRWLLQRQGGRSVKLTTHHISHSSRKLSRGKKFQRHGRLLTGRRTLIKKNEVFIATPSFVLPAFAFRRRAASAGAKDLISGCLTRHHRLAKLMAYHGASATPHVQVMAAVFNHGEMASVGDKFVEQRLGKRYFAVRQGELDEATLILSHVNQGRTQEQLERRLSRHASKKIRKAKLHVTHPRCYLRARKRYARHLLLFLRHHGLSKMATLLKVITSLPNPAPRLLT